MTHFATVRASAALLLPALLLLACAAAPPGKTDFDSGHNFSNYQSFAWLSENPMKVGKSIVTPRETLQPAIMAAIRSQLDEKGFSYEGDASTADFLVAFTVGSREKLSPDAYPSMATASGGRGGWGTAYYEGDAAASYTQGILAIDVFDNAEQRPVWHGVAGRAISEEDRENMSNVIDSVVTDILSDFPPK